MQVRFLSELITKLPATPRGLWDAPCRELWQDFKIEVAGGDGKVTIITVPKGFVFDGSTIPRLLWWIYPPGYDPAYRAATVHDYLYSRLWTQYTKQYADNLFRAIMLADGASKFSAWAFYVAVKLFGRGGWANEQDV